MTEPIFPEGIRVFPPNERGPDFVKGALLIDSLKLAAWLGQYPDGQVRLDIKTSRKSGKWYLQVNTWKPDSAQAKTVGSGGGNPAQESDPLNDEIPFVSNGGVF